MCFSSSSIQLTLHYVKTGYEQVQFNAVIDILTQLGIS